MQEAFKNIFIFEVVFISEVIFIFEVIFISSAVLVLRVVIVDMRQTLLFFHKIARGMQVLYILSYFILFHLSYHIFAKLSSSWQSSAS